MCVEKGKRTRYNPYETVEMWADQGICVHDHSDICCPDYSCCHPELLADLKTRQTMKAKIQIGDIRTVNLMLDFFSMAHALYHNAPVILTLNGREGFDKNKLM